MKALFFGAWHSAPAASADPAARWRTILAGAAVLLFFTNVVLFGFDRGVLPVTPLMGLVALLGAAAPIAASGYGIRQLLRHQLTVWAAAYLGLSALSFVITPATVVSSAEAAGRIRSATALLLFLYLFDQPRSARVARFAVAAAVIFGVILNLYEVFRPFTFSAVLYRSAGLYINPNISGGALAMGMVVAVAELPPRWRAGFVWLTGLGVIATLSRGAFLSWGIGLLGLALLRVVTFTGLARSFAVLALVGVPILAAFWQRLGLADLMALAGDRGLGIDRLWAINLGSDAGYSDMVRHDVARAGFALFLSHPWLGNGLGATTTWTFTQSTHNMFLLHMAEQGILGALLMPALALALFWGWMGHRNRTAVVAAIVVIVWSCFSHNVLEEFPFLLCIALAGICHGAESRSERNLIAWETKG